MVPVDPPGELLDPKVIDEPDCDCPATPPAVAIPDVAVFVAEDEVAGELGELSLEHVFGALWTRPGLDRRSRSLVTLGALIALRAGDELKAHFQIALHNGLTLEEIEEVIYHMTGYAGYPAAVSARKIARETIRR